MDRTIVAIYTGRGICEPVQKIINATLPDFRLISLIDDNLIGECVAAGGMTKDVEKRLLTYYKCAEEMGADIILNTCSSVGEVVYTGRQMIRTPILRIDEPMARKAVQEHSRIAVVATLSTTLEPTMRLIQREAEKIGKKIEILNGLAEGAFEALGDGRAEEHDRLLRETVKNLQEKNADCIVLAQASMMRMQNELSNSVSIPVLASPQLCMDEISRMYRKK